jgi:hypothetical protein
MSTKNSNSHFPLNKPQAMTLYDPSQFQPLLLPHTRFGVYSLTRNHLIEEFAVIKYHLPNLFKLNYQIYLKFMRDTNQQSEITEQEVDQVIDHRRPKSHQQQNQRPPSLCELARTAFCQNQGWVKTNERLVGGGMDFIEELSTHDIVCMGLDLLPQPTIAKQKMLVFAQESFCTSKCAR